MDEKRRCPTCKDDKPIGQFHLNPYRPLRCMYECDGCHAECGRQIKRDRAARLKKVRAERRQKVLDHYGWLCACCGTAKSPVIDHIEGDGREQRLELFGRIGESTAFYQWLIDNGFPDGFQTLCRRCNSSKRRGTHCRLHPQVV